MVASASSVSREPGAGKRPRSKILPLSFASGGSSRWVVFAASALALVSMSAIAVLAGEVVARHVPPLWIKRAAGALFVVLGIWTLMSAKSA